jgi:solute carrier family 9B (sodium/hydrogen exchanger), member 1/2
VCTGFLTSPPRSLALVILQAPLEVVAGIAAGGSLGWSCCYCVFPQLRVYSYPTVLLVLVTLIPVCFMLGSEQLHCQGGGAVAVVSFGFAVRNLAPAEHIEPLNESLELLWSELVQTLLFTLIGAAIDFSKLNGAALGWGTLVLVVALLVRITAAFATMLEKAHFTWWERLFVGVAWLPKATVQAAVASMPLDRLSAVHASALDIARAYQLLTISVLAIFITAPLGSVLITLLGPRWLSRDSKPDETDADVTDVTEVEEAHTTATEVGDTVGSRSADGYGC